LHTLLLAAGKLLVEAAAETVEIDPGERALGQPRNAEGAWSDRESVGRLSWDRLARGVASAALIVRGARDESLTELDDRWFRGRLRNASVRVVENAGPLLIARHWSRLLDELDDLEGWASPARGT